MFPFRDMGDLDQNPLSLFRCIGYDLRVKNDMIPTTLQDLSVLLVLLCSSLAVGQETPPQVEWFTDHSGSQEESHAHYVMTCEDGGYLQIGETGYVGASAKMFVVKTDAAGNLDWKREFGSGNKNMGNSALEVEDGYLVCGMLSRNSAILKLNKSTGATIFQRTHDLGGADAFEHLASTDNGILAVGYRNAEDPNNTFFVYGQGHISFLDANGDLLSSNSVNQHLSQAYRVEPTGDGYIIAGGTEDALQYGVIKINASGNVLWSRTFGGNNEDHCFGMDLGADGSIFLAGHTLSGTANWDTYTMKLSGSGRSCGNAHRAIPAASTLRTSMMKHGEFGPLPMEVASSRRVPATSIPILNAVGVSAPTSGRRTSSSLVLMAMCSGRRRTEATRGTTGRPKTST